LTAFHSTSHGHISAADPAFDRLFDLAPGSGRSRPSAVIAGMPPHARIASLAFRLRVAERLNTADQLESVPDNENDAGEDNELWQTEAEHCAI
jgi:hypothetical protein